MLLYKLNGDAVDQTYNQALVSLSSQVLLEDMSLLQGSISRLYFKLTCIPAVFDCSKGIIKKYIRLDMNRYNPILRVTIAVMSQMTMC